MRLWMALPFLVLVLTGCGITAAQREELIRDAVKEAGAVAEEAARVGAEKAIAKILDEAKKSGATPEELAALEAKLRKDFEGVIEEARREAEALAYTEAEKRLPKASGKGGGWLGDLLLLLLPHLAAIGAAFAKDKLGLKTGGDL